MSYVKSACEYLAQNVNSIQLWMYLRIKWLKRECVNGSVMLSRDREVHPFFVQQQQQTQNKTHESSL